MAEPTELTDSKAVAQQLVERLGGQLYNLDGTNDSSKQALADASERHGAAVTQLARATTVAEVRMAGQSATEGLHHVKVARQQMGLDPGPGTFPMQPTPPPGWYPSGSGHNRWWDGRAWGAFAQPQAAPFAQPQAAPFAQPAPTIIINNQVGYPGYGWYRPPAKSVGVAFVLAFFFGPLGLLYATVPGGLIMLGVCFFAFFLSFFMFGIPSFFAWIACIIWACVAASNSG